MNQVFPQARCPALLITAPASGQGKTTVVAAMARLFARQGKRVRVFKSGPDFLDPQIHTLASGAPVYNLDLGMCGESDARWRLTEAAAEADLIIVEGVMGLFDGTPSSADIAELFGIPVMAVIDASAMAQTFGAVAHGLASYRPGLRFSGVLANRVGSPGHAAMLRDAVPSGMRWYGALPRDAEATLPERHLGLLQAAEIPDLLTRLDRFADALEQAGVGHLPAEVVFEQAERPVSPPLLAGRRIAIARDAAYGFIYPANLDTLRDLGAELCFFSPLAGEALPRADAVWLPGGYPELHGEALAGRRDLWQALREFVADGRPLLAECGGMMSLFDVIVDKQGQAHSFAGMLPGSAVLQSRFVALGTQWVDLTEGTLSGHTYHHSRTETELTPLLHARRADGWPGEAVYRQGRLTASYVHLYFPSNPEAVSALFSFSTPGGTAAAPK